MPASSSKSRRVINVFIASPNDVQRERELFKEIVNEVNKLKANPLGIQLEPLGWEDTLPGKGRPQGLINKDIEKSDLVVMLLWKRWGTPSGKYSSGFEEEYELARELNKKNGGRPEISLYFRSIPEEMLADPGEQLRKVLDFRKKIEQEREFLYKPYENEAQWEKLLRVHLCEWLDRLGEGGISGRIPPGPPPLPTRIELPVEDIRAITETLAKEAVVKAESGQLTTAEEYFARSIAVLPGPNTINLYGLFLHRIGLLDRAEKQFRQVEAIGERLGERYLLAVAYGNLGIVYKTRGELDKAEEMYGKSLAINEELGLKEGMANAYGNLGIVYKTRGELDKAEEMYRKSLEIDKELGRKEGVASQYGNLGIVYKTRGELDKAEEMYGKSLAINEELGRKEGMANAYGNLGIVYKTRGELDKAEEMYRKSLEIDKELGRKEGMANAYGNLGNVYRIRGELDKAEEMYRKSLAIEKELGRKEGVASAYGNLGIVYQIRGELDKAEEMYRKSLEINEELGRKEGMANAYGNLGNVYKTRGELDKAEEMCRKALALFTSIGSKLEIERVKSLMGELRNLKKMGK